MAAYNVEDWVTSEGTLAEVADAMRVKIETLDDTTGTVLFHGIVPVQGAYGRYQGWIIHRG